MGTPMRLNTSPEKTWGSLTDVERTALQVASARWIGSQLLRNPATGKPYYGDPYGARMVSSCVPRSNQLEFLAAFAPGLTCIPDPSAEAALDNTPISSSTTTTTTSSSSHAFSAEQQQVFASSRAAFMAVRTAALDQMMRDVLAENPALTQVVLLGAGMDTRAWRFRSWHPGTHLFEVDSPSLSSFKQQIMAGISPSCSMWSSVGADARQIPQLEQQLMAAGFKKSSCVISLSSTAAAGGEEETPAEPPAAAGGGEAAQATARAAEPESAEPPAAAGGEAALATAGAAERAPAEPPEAGAPTQALTAGAEPPAAGAAPAEPAAARAAVASAHALAAGTEPPAAGAAEAPPAQAAVIGAEPPAAPAPAPSAAATEAGGGVGARQSGPGEEITTPSSTLWLLEGFIGYLTREEGGELLRWMAGVSAPGSVLIMTAPPGPRDWQGRQEQQQQQQEEQQELLQEEQKEQVQEEQEEQVQEEQRVQEQQQVQEAAKQVQYEHQQGKAEEQQEAPQQQQQIQSDAAPRPAAGAAAAAAPKAIVLHHAVFEEVEETVGRMEAAGWRLLQLVRGEQLAELYGTARAQAIIRATVG